MQTGVRSRTFGFVAPAAFAAALTLAPGASTTQARVNAVPAAPSTVTISSAAGWQDTHFALTKGQAYTVSYLSGTWTVGRLNPNPAPLVGPEGYSDQEDQKIFQGCKVDNQQPYATLLSQEGPANGSGNQWRVSRGGIWTSDATGTLFLRINDQDACLGDNGGSIKVKISPGVAAGTIASPFRPTIYDAHNGFADTTDFKDPNPKAPRCTVGTQLDHCANQLFGVDLFPADPANTTEVLAPIGGKINWPQKPKGDCLGILTPDGLNLTVCHLTFTLTAGTPITRGAVLGTRTKGWVHLSLDDRRSTPALPVPFDASHTLDGATLTPAHSTNARYSPAAPQQVTFTGKRCNTKPAACKFTVSLQEWQHWNNDSSSVTTTIGNGDRAHQSMPN